MRLALLLLCPSFLENLEVEELQAVLQSAYDPRKESLDVFEAPVNRAAESLLMLGIEVADRQEEGLARGQCRQGSVRRY